MVEFQAENFTNQLTQNMFKNRWNVFKIKTVFWTFFAQKSYFWGGRFADNFSYSRRGGFCLTRGCQSSVKDENWMVVPTLVCKKISFIIFCKNLFLFSNCFYHRQPLDNLWTLGSKRDRYRPAHFLDQILWWQHPRHRRTADLFGHWLVQLQLWHHWKMNNIFSNYFNSRCFIQQGS